VSLDCDHRVCVSGVTSLWLVPGRYFQGAVLECRMRVLPATELTKTLVVCLLLVLVTGRAHGSLGDTPSSITIDYPLNGSMFPPEITAPTFLWHDDSGAKRWVVEIAFRGRAPKIRLDVQGERFQVGEIDSEASYGDELAKVIEAHSSTRTWKADANTWKLIKSNSVKAPATITITGFSEGQSTSPLSQASVTISTSSDPVGAPVFYRDVPLMLSPRTADGSIQPLPPSAIPLIKWRLRNVGEPESRVVMENLPTCANCHSFSGDGKTFGLDLDGPKNDKGIYALMPVSSHVVIRNQDVIRWSSFQDANDPNKGEPSAKRFGFMSQVSPDGRYVVTSIAPPKLANVHKSELPDFVPGLADRLFSMNYPDVAFTQVFYPTRGILVWYDREKKTLHPLPGADDPQFVHTSAFWSPDGKYLIFSRAEARDPYPPGAAKPEHANDPNEPQIQYDLYKIPFNDGKGGKAEPVVGASRNGMSNNFPKVSPDGRWIVFVQNRNGLLMRPDSKLYIVPFGGGKAGLMHCNTSLMNSWHTFSPNGRWLAFSSKARSPYTQLMLTHIDAHGNDTPAILLENTTAANRAVNIPEFVNIPSNGLEKIDPQATEFYRLFNVAFDAMEKNQLPDAIRKFGQALQEDPEDALAHYALATSLSRAGKEEEALNHYRKACELNPRNGAWLAHFATSLALTGDREGAIATFRRSLELNASDAGSEADLGTLLVEAGKVEEGYEHLKKAVMMAPNFAEGHSRLGIELAKMGRYDEAVAELSQAVALVPGSAEFLVNLGYAQGLRGNSPEAVAALQKAVQVTDAKDWRCLDLLAKAYGKSGDLTQAIETERRALELAVQANNVRLEQTLRTTLESYERESGHGR
jgi:Flp pilus assembly protein TadD